MKIRVRLYRNGPLGLVENGAEPLGTAAPVAADQSDSVARSSGSAVLRLAEPASIQTPSGDDSAAGAPEPLTVGRRPGARIEVWVGLGLIGALLVGSIGWLLWPGAAPGAKDAVPARSASAGPDAGAPAGMATAALTRVEPVSSPAALPSPPSPQGSAGSGLDSWAALPLVTLPPAPSGRPLSTTLCAPAAPSGDRPSAVKSVPPGPRATASPACRAVPGKPTGLARAPAAAVKKAPVKAAAPKPAPLTKRKAVNSKRRKSKTRVANPVQSSAAPAFWSGRRGATFLGD